MLDSCIEGLVSVRVRPHWECLPLGKFPQLQTVRSSRNGVRLFSRAQKRTPLNQTNSSRTAKVSETSIERSDSVYFPTYDILCPMPCQSEK
jgi:hypothetical protein